MSLDIHEEQKKLQPFGFLGKDFAVMQVVKGENGHDDKYPLDPRNGRLMKWKQDPCFTNLHTTFVNLAGVRKANPDMRFEVGALLTKDLIMLDIKHIDPEEHKKLTAQPIDNILDFLSYLDEKEKTIWIRHVLVPGITLIPEYLERLGYYIGQFKHIKALDVLPYHSMGKTKYEQLGIDYVLKDVPEATKEQAIEARGIIIEAMKKRRHDMGE